MKTYIKVFGSLLIIIIIGIVFWLYLNLKDRNPGYKADIKIINLDMPGLNAGFAAFSITPEVPDRWSDNNHDAEYNPKDGDTFFDGNRNGKFDPVWMAGFGNGRAANGIHDDLWARTFVIDDGKTRLAIVALDAIGFMNNEVIDARKRISAEAGVTYTIVLSTHTHQGSDLIGLWGKSPFKSGVNREYLEFVKNQIVKSVETAVMNMRPVILAVSKDMTGAVPLVTDTREPIVFDSGLRTIQTIDKENGNTLGSVIAWADHPETLWSRNLLITSDFPHYVREGVEKGIFNGDSLVKPGVGGVAIYVNGAIGGLITTPPDLSVKDPFSGQEFKDPTFEKAEAQGRQLALLVLNAMERSDTIVEMAGISLNVRTIILPIENRMFRLAAALGILDRGITGWMKVRTELSVFNIGPLSFAAMPGEVYPEIVNGGVEAPESGDFGSDPGEVPPVRDLMSGEYKFIFGLANDEIGYVIPKSQWDEKEPFTYGRRESPYGEENSLGPETAPLLYKNLKGMLSELNQP